MVTPVATAKVLPGGIYCPTITFFLNTPEQELDIPTHVKHIEFLAKSGIAGVVVMGSTGEAVSLTREERMELTRSAKEAFTRVGSSGIIIAGTVGAQSTREAILLSKDAAACGADFVLILPPSYYPGIMTPDAIQGFFEDVADASPIPVIIYSYPGVCSGINMDTDLIGRLAAHPNIAGIKHTDHDVGKIGRLSQRKFGSSFTILGGATDYLLGALAVGGKGAITGLANIAPRVCNKALELFQAGKAEEALTYAEEISKGEWGMGKGMLTGTKYAVTWANGFPDSAAYPRKPLPHVTAATIAHIQSQSADVVALERKLEKEGWTGPNLISANGVKSTKSNGIVGSIKQAVASI